MTTARTIPVTVREIVDVTPFVKRFRLERTDGAPLPTFAGGAHVIVEMHDGPITRRNAYSLMSEPWDNSHYMISVRRDDTGRGGSRHLHEAIQPGSTLHISYPVNLFPIDQRAKKHLFLAGGIGITPFLAMMDQLARDHRPFDLHYINRSPTHAAYADDLARSHGHHVHLYQSDDGDMIPLESVLAHQPLGTHLYVCGPSGMIEWAIATAEDLGWPLQNIHYERFLSPPTGEQYEVMLKRSDRTIQVGAHQSMLEAFEAAGVEAPYLCRGGACGQCETDVLDCDGTLLHADHFLTEAEKEAGHKIMPCVSRFKGRMLILDR